MCHDFDSLYHLGRDCFGKMICLRNEDMIDMAVLPTIGMDGVITTDEGGRSFNGMIYSFQEEIDRLRAELKSKTTDAENLAYRVQVLEAVAEHWKSKYDDLLWDYCSLE